MKEVSGKIIGLYLSALPARDRPALLEGLPAGWAGRAPERIGWEAFCQLSERLERLLGSRAALAGVGASILGHGDFTSYQAAFRLVAGPRLLYWASNRWAGPSMFSHVLNQLEDIDSDRLRIAVQIPEGYADSPQFFAINQGLFQAMPRVLGLPDSVVVLEQEARRGTYTISMPPSLTLWARLRRAFGIFFHAKLMFEELAVQQEALQLRYAELLQAHEQALQARDAAEQALGIKSDFLATMSHELYTPLNGILGAAELLRIDAGLTPGQADLVDSIASSGAALLKMVRNILDHSRLERGELALESQSFSPRELLEEVVRGEAMRAWSRGLALTLSVDSDIPAQVRGDPARLRQVLLGLLDNAIRFTARGSVEVCCELAAGDTSAGLRFAVRDTGPGIASEDQARLFQPFSQLHQGTGRRYEGSGMGLAVYRQIVEKAGGQIGVQSTPGQGSLFWFFLPLCAPAAAPARPAIPARRRVLVVEDNPINQQILGGMLRRLGAEVLLAADGQQALDLLAAQAAAGEGGPDLVLMDCHMPGMDGFEATRRIRRLPPEQGGMPILAVTADRSPGIGERCREAGMEDCLHKPVSLELLRQVLARWRRLRPVA